MRILQVLLVTVLSYSFTFASAAVSRGDVLINDISDSSDSQRATRVPAGYFRHPGILPCPDQSQTSKISDLARLENHSKDCQPTTGGALKLNPNQPSEQEPSSDIPLRME